MALMIHVLKDEWLIEFEASFDMMSMLITDATLACS